MANRGLTLIVALSSCPAPLLAADAAHPLVLELYQAQGCASCPPADANVAALADRPDILTLSFAVTYWDRLGWKDTFAKPIFTRRQLAYAKAMGRAEVFTPQVVINGRVDGVGADPDKLRDLIGQGERGAGGPQVIFHAASVTLSAAPAPAGGADVWLVRYDPRIIQVPIRAGENGGKTLPHRNIVKGLVRLGGWSGAAESFSLETPGDPALKTAILVQRPKGGVIIAAAAAI